MKISDFKAWEKVRVNDPKNYMRLHKYLHGKEGQITPLGDGEIQSQGCYYVKIDDTIWGMSKEHLEKIEDKQEEKQEPFELKEGMKFKIEDTEELPTFRNKILELHHLEYRENQYKLYYNPSCCVSEDFIDWQATRKLNEVKEEPKQELYVIWNPKGSNPKYKHTTLEEAEKEAERLANANPNQEFYVLIAVKKAVGKTSVKVEWE